MNKQIQDLKTDQEFITLLGLLTEIYGDNESTTRKKAIKHFNSLLKLRLNYDKLKYDVCDIKTNCREKLPEENVSKLVNSLFPDIIYYDNAFWEHTMHLVYHTAFGTIRQWPDMWEEFMLIKPYLQKAYDEKKKDDNGNVLKDANDQEISINQTAKDVIDGIEKYIINLQSQSR
jgi:hypothetical protein